MSKTRTTTTTREFDEEGRLVKETVVEVREDFAEGGVLAQPITLPSVNPHYIGIDPNYYRPIHVRWPHVQITGSNTPSSSLTTATIAAVLDKLSLGVVHSPSPTDAES